MQRNGKNYCVYAYPAHYQIYVGDPSQYQRYQQLRLANNLAQDPLETAQLNNMTAMWRCGNLGGNRWIRNIRETPQAQMLISNLIAAAWCRTGSDDFGDEVRSFAEC